MDNSLLLSKDLGTAFTTGPSVEYRAETTRITDRRNGVQKILNFDATLSEASYIPPDMSCYGFVKGQAVRKLVMVLSAKPLAQMYANGYHWTAVDLPESGQTTIELDYTT